MPLIIQILLACLLGGLLSLLAAFLILYGLPKKWLAYAVSFSTGVLLGTSMLHLLPEALDSGLSPQEVFPVLLAGILGFFALEKFSIWRHSHHHEDDGQMNTKSVATTSGHHHGDAGVVGILIGDGFHNFTDGVLIAAAFLTDPALGWATTLAVIAHEIPQEAGDFAILLAAGWERKKALFWNGISSLASVAGGVIAYFSLEHTENWIPYVVIVAASSFIYIAIADLLPRLKFQFQGLGWHSLHLLMGVAVTLL
jgi:zinc and cadmium transporter